MASALMVSAVCCSRSRKDRATVLSTARKVVTGTRASGGMNLDNIVAYAQTGVDFISVGAIIHHAVSMDLSLKAQVL